MKAFWTSCDWCNASNPASEHWCRLCSHAAHVSRSKCDCSACLADRILPGLLAQLAEKHGVPDERGAASFPE